MAWNFNISIGKQITSVERDVNGNFHYTLLDNLINNGSFKSYSEILKEVISNPAVMKVLSFRADIFSQVHINKYSNDKLVEENSIYTLLKKPNYWQTWTDLHWDIEFFRCLGAAYIYKNGETIYCLNPANIEIDNSVIQLFQKLVFSIYGLKNEFKNKTFKYKLPNNKSITLNLNNLTILSDLSGTIGMDFFNPISRLNSLYQICKNSKLSILSKSQNLDFSKKFLVSGQHNPSDTTSIGMSEDEKNSIEQGLLGKRKIHATKSKVEINHLVSNLKQLGLDEAYLSDLTVIANMYGIDTDVLGISGKKSTYENKEKGFGAFIDYTLMPKVQQLTDMYEVLFEQEDLRGSFNHLPFNEVFQADKIANKEKELNNLKTAKELGVDEKILKEKATLIISE